MRSRLPGILISLILKIFKKWTFSEKWPGMTEDAPF